MAVRNSIRANGIRPGDREALCDDIDEGEVAQERVRELEILLERVLTSCLIGHDYTEVPNDLIADIRRAVRS